MTLAPALAGLGLALLAACATTSVRGLDGRPLDPLADAEGHALVLIFTDPQCPISNAYAPELRRLVAEFEPRGVRFFLVYADPERTAEEVRSHVQAYGYPMPAVLDGAQELTERVGARTVPEACVFTAGGELAYRGRIDDRYVDFGRQRAAPTVRDLALALEAVLVGRLPARPWPAAIGCAIP